MIEKKTTRPAKRKPKLQAGVDAMHLRYSQVFARLAEGLDEIALHCALSPPRKAPREYENHDGGPAK